MTTVREFITRFASLFRKQHLEREMDDEMRAHLEFLVEENLRRGMSSEEARYCALREFGGLDQTKEVYRDQRGLPMIERIIQDVRFGLRVLVKNPGFTAVAVLTLALGIGANTAIFTLVNALLLRNLPVHDPGRLVLFSDNANDSISMSPGIPSGRQTEFSYPFYSYVRDHSRLFESICAFQTPDDTLTIREEAQTDKAVEVAQGKLVSGNFFSVLGVGAAMGRTLTPADDQATAPPVAVVSFDYWQRTFGANPGVVGRIFDIDGVPTTVVGIAPRGFFGVRMESDSADFWMPLSLRPRLTLTVMPDAKSLLADPNTYWLDVMGRLKPSVSLDSARAEIDSELRQFISGSIGSKITEAEQRQVRSAYIALVGGGQGLSALRHEYSTPLGILLAIVALVLLIACGNVANLMLARAAARKKEMATRLALGGTRGRLLRQILTESALLAITGGVAGAILAYWGVRLLVAMVAARVPLNVTPDLAVFAFTASISAVAVILCGLAPGLRSARVELLPALKEGSVSGVGHRTLLGLGNGLVVLQIATSLLLMVGAGLLVSSLMYLENEKLGFNPDHVLLVNIDPELAGYNSEKLPGLYQELMARMNALPGVRSASVGMTSPMSGSWGGFEVSVEGEPPPSGGSAPQAVAVGPRYFETEGIRIVAGRGISAQDSGSSARVVVVNQAFARKYIPQGHPIGRRLGLGTPFRPPGVEIVGVAADARYKNARDPAGPMFFLSAFQLQSVMVSVNEIEVRAAGDPASLAGEVREAIHEIDSNLPITNITTLATQVNDSMSQQRAISGLTGFFGILGLVLASVGLYGILGHGVVRRTHEIGIRRALGATQTDVLRLILGQGFKLTMAGVVIGIIAALTLTRFLSSLLYGIKPIDPVTFVLVPSFLVAVALLASYIPARRATKVDPTVALRHE